MQAFQFITRSRARHAVLCGVVTLVVAVCANARNQGKQGHHQLSAPVISGTPATTDVAGTSYSFTPQASGPSGYPLTFAISGKPAWATFNSSSGSLAGTPTTANVGTYSAIVITVSNGLASASLAPFAINVSAPADIAPTISGQPVTSLNVGATYSFTPTAADANGDKLTYAIQNKPSWASFNAASGLLSGIPAAGTAGTYGNIVISVSDGVMAASLPAFAITVNQVSNGSATVSWLPPTANSDGTVLTNLAGYRIQYGTAANALSNTIQVASTGLTTYVVSNLSPGTWYFGMVAYTASGAQSALSNIGSKTIQ